jgi:hypothetical protein
MKLDVIGDVHGKKKALETLLTRLGYAPLSGVWRHPGGRKAVFVGDLVDRGPDVSDVLALVKAMVDAGEAWMVLGNHELGLLGWYTQSANGEYRRKHQKKYLKYMGPSIALFDHFKEEHAVYLEWFTHTPLTLELGGARFVHAYWDHKTVAKIKPGASLHDLGWSEPSFTHANKERADLLTKGPELNVPEGVVVTDRQGNVHDKARMNWWRIDSARDMRELIKPDTAALAGHPIPDKARAYGPPQPGEAPLFFGHFGFNECPGLIGPNYTCVDFTGEHGTSVGAYRWDGEDVLSEDKLVT